MKYFGGCDVGSTYTKAVILDENGKMVANTTIKSKINSEQSAIAAMDEGRGIRILRLDDKLQMCSAPEYASYISKALEQRKPPMLSQSALETLAVVAYFQPVTRAYIDQVRGVDSSYTVGVLTQRGLIEPCGKLDVPGRPSVFRTTDVFLRTMGISELSQLPELPDMTNGEGIEKLQNAIDQLQNKDSQQLSFSEVTGENGEPVKE